MFLAFSISHEVDDGQSMSAVKILYRKPNTYSYGVKVL